MEKQIKVELQEYMGSDRTIAEAAWTSSYSLGTKAKKSEIQVTELVKRLANEGHATPFETVVFRFWIKLPIQSDRQLMTHRIMSSNSLSGRYRTMPNEFLEIPEDIKLIFNKIDYNDYYLNLYNEVCKNLNKEYRLILDYLKLAEKANKITNLEYKRIREFYRGILPLNNITERVITINLRSFANFQRLRNSEHAQLEIRQIAKAMLQLVEQANICPVAIKTLKNNGWRL